MALITKGGTSQIRPNFNESELQSGSWRNGFTDAVDSFELSDNTLDALQFLRDHYGVAMGVNSTYRSDLHNASLTGSASLSFHKLKKAIVRATDFHFIGAHIKGSKAHLADIDYYHQINNKKGVVYDTLVNTYKIKGLGLYDNFNHIDSRVQSGVNFWDNSTKKKSYIEAITSTIQNNEDGVLDWKNSIITTGVIILIIIAALIWWFKYKK